MTQVSKRFLDKRVKERVLDLLLAVWRVDHGSYTSLYAHLLTINVYPGESVKRNQKIGEVGATGRSTGPHLHFETKENGQPIDPLTLL